MRGSEKSEMHRGFDYGFGRWVVALAPRAVRRARCSTIECLLAIGR